MLVSENPIITSAISAGILVLGLPAAFVAISFENVHMPKVVLGTKEVDVGRLGKQSLQIELISGPNDAVTAAAAISVACSLALVVALAVMRHINRSFFLGWAVLIPALVNMIGQFAIIAYVNIMSNENPAAKSIEDVQYINGHYDTNGKMYTREAWACTMDKFYPEQEGSWADKACSSFKTGRMMTIPLLICSFIIFAIAYWQVSIRGGFAWLFGRNKQPAADDSYKTKALRDLEARS